MHYFSSFFERGKKILKWTAESIESGLGWLRPFGIKARFLEINIQKMSKEVLEETQTYRYIGGLERKISKLENDKCFDAKTFGYIRTGMTLAGPLAVWAAHYVNPFFYGKDSSEDHSICYLSALIVSYLIGTILGKLGKIHFETGAREELTHLIKYYNTPEECEQPQYEFLQPNEEFTLDESDLATEAEEQSKPTTKPRVDKREYIKPNAAEPLKFDFEKFYEQYCKEFPPEDKKPPTTN